MNVTYRSLLMCVMCGTKYRGTWTDARMAQDQDCPACGYVTRGAEWTGFFSGPRWMVPPGASIRYSAREGSPVVIPLGTFTDG